jgi:hypothetical protein
VSQPIRVLPDNEWWQDVVEDANPVMMRSWEEDFQETPAKNRVLQQGTILELRRQAIRSGVKVLAMIFDTTTIQALKRLYELSGWTPLRYWRLLQNPADPTEFAQWCSVVEAIETAIARYSPRSSTAQDGDGPAPIQATDREVVLATQRLARMRTRNAKVSEQKTVESNCADNQT